MLPSNAQSISCNDHNRHQQHTSQTKRLEQEQFQTGRVGRPGQPSGTPTMICSPLARPLTMSWSPLHSQTASEKGFAFLGRDWKRWTLVARQHFNAWKLLWKVKEMQFNERVSKLIATVKEVVSWRLSFTFKILFWNGFHPVLDRVSSLPSKFLI